ncbi:MAG TPA: TadE family type IV pilus minor pilin [Micromonosporaceae bacterium]|jgi:Flp pilus assembly protein TadG
MVTAEFAVALPALVLLLGFALGAVGATMDKLRCIDAAREAALATSRGSDGAALGRADGPAGASVTVTSADGVVRATVSVRTRPLGSHLPGIVVTGTAVAALEPGSTS